MHRIAERMTEMSADLRLDELAILTQALYIAQKINIALQVVVLLLFTYHFINYLI